jgi:hypothetical protein
VRQRPGNVSCQLRSFTLACSQHVVIGSMTSCFTQCRGVHSSILKGRFGSHSDLNVRGSVVKSPECIVLKKYSVI